MDVITPPMTDILMSKVDSSRIESELEVQSIKSKIL